MIVRTTGHGVTSDADVAKPPTALVNLDATIAADHSRMPWPNEALEGAFVRHDALDGPVRELLWSEIERRFHPQTDRVLSRGGISLSHDRDDVWQATLLQAYRMRGAYNSEAGSLSTWFGVIARDCTRKWRRRKHMQTRSTEEMDCLLSTSARASSTTQVEAQENLDKDLAPLEPLELTILRAFYLHGDKVDSIAEKLLRSRRAVEGILYRAKRKLRRRLRGESSLELPSSEPSELAI